MGKVDLVSSYKGKDLTTAINKAVESRALNSYGEIIAANFNNLDATVFITANFNIPRKTTEAALKPMIEIGKRMHVKRQFLGVENYRNQDQGKHIHGLIELPSPDLIYDLKSELDGYGKPVVEPVIYLKNAAMYAAKTLVSGNDGDFYFYPRAEKWYSDMK